MAHFQSFWHGASLPPYQRLAIKSFLDHGHTYSLFCYTPLDLPSGAEWRDASEILPQDRVFFYGPRAGVGEGSVAGFSNVFRYKLLEERGGWWVDTDVICLSDTLPEGELYSAWEYRDLIGNAILKFPPGHRLVRELCRIAEDSNGDIVWGELGPNLLTRLSLELDMLDPVVAQTDGYPIQSWNALDLLLPEKKDAVRALVKDRPFLHVWNEILRRAVVFTWMAPPDGSYLADLFSVHDVGFGTGPAYTADQIRRLRSNYSAAATWAHDNIYGERISALESELASLRQRELSRNNPAGRRLRWPFFSKAGTQQ